MNTPEFSLVIPLYNEEDNVKPLQDEILRALDGHNYELILVDDGSTDGTATRVTKHPGVRLIRFEINSGQSAAILAGIRAARAPLIVLLDGDLQNDPADIPTLLKAMESGADLVCGYRKHRRDTVVKRITSRVANFVRSRFVGDGIRDTGCSLKVFRQECAGALVPFKGVHRFIPALIKSAGFRVVEVPVNHRHRRHGVSKYGLGNRALRATTDMLGVKWLQSRRIPLDSARELG
ncbi:MAG: glycosyltransferase family 2 protein [Terrimicrobiaceae bacterium]